ncbi:hypothetical protein WJX81_001175 [Elliptochloris bilobata]|uniref:Uncharacterized protein n=1 Tax=Elliptochloris bilobata TaxID=381761 RepID=A0AAW1SCT6_9CHLO
MRAAPVTGESEVVASGKALSIAQRLLGVSSLQDVLPWEADEAPARPLGLGLGAKYLPHSKAMALARPLEKQLARRLQRRVDLEAAVGPSCRNGEQGAAGGSSASEDEGRAGAFRDPPKAGTRAAQPAWREAGAAKRKKKKRERGAANTERPP